MIKTLGAIQELVLRTFVQREFHESLVIERKQPVLSVAVELTTERGFPLRHHCLIYSAVVCDPAHSHFRAGDIQPAVWKPRFLVQEQINQHDGLLGGSGRLEVAVQSLEPFLQQQLQQNLRRDAGDHVLRAVGDRLTRCSYFDFVDEAAGGIDLEQVGLKNKLASTVNNPPFKRFANLTRALGGVPPDAFEGIAFFLGKGSDRQFLDRA